MAYGLSFNRKSGVPPFQGVELAELHLTAEHTSEGSLSGQYSITQTDAQARISDFAVNSQTADTEYNGDDDSYNTKSAISSDDRTGSAETKSPSSPVLYSVNKKTAATIECFDDLIEISSSDAQRARQIDAKQQAELDAENKRLREQIAKENKALTDKAEKAAINLRMEIKIRAIARFAYREINTDHFTQCAVSEPEITNEIIGKIETLIGYISNKKALSKQKVNYIIQQMFLRISNKSEARHLIMEIDDALAYLKLSETSLEHPFILLKTKMLDELIISYMSQHGDIDLTHENVAYLRALAAPYTGLANNGEHSLKRPSDRSTSRKGIWFKSQTQARANGEQLPHKLCEDFIDVVRSAICIETVSKEFAADLTSFLAAGTTATLISDDGQSLDVDKLLTDLPKYHDFAEIEPCLGLILKLQALNLKNIRPMELQALIQELLTNKLSEHFIRDTPQNIPLGDASILESKNSLYQTVITDDGREIPIGFSHAADFEIEKNQSRRVMSIYHQAIINTADTDELDKGMAPVKGTQPSVVACRFLADRQRRRMKAHADGAISPCEVVRTIANSCSESQLVAILDHKAQHSQNIGELLIASAKIARHNVSNLDREPLKTSLRHCSRKMLQIYLAKPDSIKLTSFEELDYLDEYSKKQFLNLFGQRLQKQSNFDEFYKVCGHYLAMQTPLTAWKQALVEKVRQTLTSRPKQTRLQLWVKTTEVQDRIIEVMSSSTIEKAKIELLFKTAKQQSLLKPIKIRLERSEKSADRTARDTSASKSKLSTAAVFSSVIDEAGLIINPETP